MKKKEKLGKSQKASVIVFVLPLPLRKTWGSFSTTKPWFPRRRVVRTSLPIT